MSYKKLGDIVKFISNKNVDGIATILYGINIDKYFMPSVANTIGVDLKKYKVVVKNQFACNRMHVGRDKRLPISMSTFDYPFIVSPAYDVFEVTDENVIPEYLMLWFRRSEFDRQCWFYTDADVRGGLSLDALKSIEIRIPSIEKQREIVAQYQAVANKIKVNEQICEKLEATAQTLYKQWFVDFEFPNEEGKPYKSSGGAMVYNQELEKEIPEGWEVGILSDLITVKYGKDYKHLNKGNIPLYGSGGIMSYVDEILYDKPSVLIPRKGSLNNILYIKTPFWSVDTMFYTIPKIDNTLIYVFNVLSKMDFNSLNVGSAVPSMTTEYLNSMQILIPENNVLKPFDIELNQLEDYKISIIKQNQKLTQLQSLLLSRLATLEG
ncbi:MULTISPECIES: restriction endonuclease subunit S [unclassified Empedobacter]|uniref:restriction endonuclease subunit S n=1 Tax=unclassified Empedobacter TaxID=2643773 RepID=UPI0025C580F4|nr:MULTISPECIES: restriction endonuclease subunit S [unclassified Empedobacter]